MNNLTTPTGNHQEILEKVNKFKENQTSLRKRFPNPRMEGAWKEFRPYTRDLLAYFPQIAESYIQMHSDILMAKDALEELEAQDSGVVGSTKRSDCMASIARIALSQLSQYYTNE